MILSSIRENSGAGDTVSRNNIIMNLKKFFLLLNVFFYIIVIHNTVLANNIKNSAVVFMYHKFDIPKYPSTNIIPEQFIITLRRV